MANQIVKWNGLLDCSMEICANLLKYDFAMREVISRV